MRKRNVKTAELQPLKRIGKIRIIANRDPGKELSWAVGQRIQMARHRNGWKQEELARRSGIAQANISRLEQGRHVPSIPTLQKVARALNLELSFLLQASASGIDAEDRVLAESGIAEWGKALDALERDK